MRLTHRLILLAAAFVWATAAQPQSIGPGVWKTVASASVPATTFDPLHNTNATLTNGNLTATLLGGGNPPLGVYSIAHSTSGQNVYVEVTVDLVTFGASIGFGNDNTVTGRFPGIASPSTGWIVQTNGIFSCQDSVDAGAGITPTFGTGDQIDVAISTSLNKFWVRVNNGAWNSVQGGTQDPATGAGGVTFSPVAGPYYYFAGQDAVNNDGFTARFSSSSWLHAAPAGFTQLQ